MPCCQHWLSLICLLPELFAPTAKFPKRKVNIWLWPANRKRTIIGRNEIECKCRDLTIGGTGGCCTDTDQPRRRNRRFSLLAKKAAVKVVAVPLLQKLFARLFTGKFDSITHQSIALLTFYQKFFYFNSIRWNAKPQDLKNCGRPGRSVRCRNQFTAICGRLIHRITFNPKTKL